MAKVYVGTYAKYNNGSLAGAWIDLAECGTYENFLKKCKEVHKNEPDPEYMIQDTEDFPDGLSCMEWLSENDFNDIIEAIKREESETVASQPKADNGAKFKEWLEEYRKIAGMGDYYAKESVGAVKINGRFYMLRKPHIKNRFCFHDEGPDYEFYKSLMADEKKLEQYFLDKNLRQFDREECRDTKYNWYVKYQGTRCDVMRMDDWTRQRYCYEDYEPLTDGIAIKELEAGKQWSRDKFEKRLRTYLKRYGTSKIHTWTYWADR